MALDSPGSYTGAKCCEASPLVGFVNREFVVCDIGSVNLARTVTSNERPKGLVKQRGVICIRTQTPSCLQ